MTERIRVFVDERAVEVMSGSVARDAVAALDSAAAAALDEGRAHLTDGVGRLLAAETSLEPGSIVRVIRSAPRRP